jgi:membrane-bound lytic murein transglycosylase MltF
VAINDLQTLKAEKYPDLAWRVDEKCSAVSAARLRGRVLPTR